MILYHGGQRWSGPAEIKQQRKGHAEHGPGIYLTTSWETANKYAKGGGSVYRLEVKPPQVWSDEASISVEAIREFALKTFGRGRKSKLLMDGVERVASRTGDFIPATSFIAIGVNNNINTGAPGVAMAKFLSSFGIGASRESMGSEDYVVVHDPSLVASVTRINPEEVRSEGFEFDLPRVKSSATRVAFLYEFGVT